MARAALGGVAGVSISVDVEKRLGDFALRLTFDAEPGITALFGPSGSGKTSALNMVAGLLRPDAGRIITGDRVLFDAAEGVDLPPEARRAGYVFQEARLFPHLRVRANLLYGERPGGFGFDEAVALLGLSALLDRWPRHLSGGEAQRVAIGRALVSNPEFLLLDEPLAHLDRARREGILAAIERLRDATGLPMLYVTHDAAEIERLGARRVDL